MLNTLANHGYLPHNGQNITYNITRNALYSALNIAEDLAEYLFKEAITTNPEDNATEFSLHQLTTHNILEHDASLRYVWISTFPSPFLKASKTDLSYPCSRIDAYFGDAGPFNQTIYEQTRSYWTTEIITLQQAADARLARLNESKTIDPNYTLSELGENFSYGESAGYLIVLGNKTTNTVPRKWVEYLFGKIHCQSFHWSRSRLANGGILPENERLPNAEGWFRRTESITFDDLDWSIMEIMEASGVDVGGNGTESKKRKRGGMHTPFYL